MKEDILVEYEPTDDLQGELSRAVQRAVAEVVLGRMGAEQAEHMQDQLLEWDGETTKLVARVMEFVKGAK